MRRGQAVTNIVAGFAAKRFVGVRGEIVDAPFLPICRNQIDIKFQCDSLHLAERMPGFHWMTCYGDCTKEIGYASSGWHPMGVFGVGVVSCQLSVVSCQ